MDREIKLDELIWIDVIMMNKETKFLIFIVQVLRVHCVWETKVSTDFSVSSICMRSTSSTYLSLMMSIVFPAIALFIVGSWFQDFNRYSKNRHKTNLMTEIALLP